jgi:hypothetical protein
MSPKAATTTVIITKYNEGGELSASNNLEELKCRQYGRPFHRRNR